MSGKYSIWADIFGRRQRPSATTAVPAAGETFYHQPAIGPVEYAQVIGVYTEAADIRHVRFRLYYRYQEKTEDLGEKTLAADLFSKRFHRRLETDSAAE